MVRQERLDRCGPVDWMAIENQNLVSGEQEGQQIPVKVGDEAFRRHLPLIAELAFQAVIGEPRYGADGLPRRDWLFIDYAFAVRRTTIGQGQIQAGSGFVQIDALIKGNFIDLAVIAFGFSPTLRCVLFRVIGRLFFRVIPRRFKVACIAVTLGRTP